MAEGLLPGDVVAVRVLERHPWGLDVAVVRHSEQIGFVEPNMIGNGRMPPVEEFPAPGRVVDAIYMGDTAQGLLRFSLNPSDKAVG